MATTRFLNRHVKFFVETTPATTDPVAPAVFTEMPHNGIEFSGDVVEANLTTTADNGRRFTLPAERADSFTVNGKTEFDPDTGDPHPAQEKLRELNGLVDYEALGNFRLEILGKIRKEFSGWVKVQDFGGDQNEGAPFSVEVHGNGIITTSIIAD